VDNIVYNIENKSNKFDHLTILFIVLQIFGALGGLFQPIRIFVVFLLPFFFLSFTKKKSISSYYYEFVFFVFWIFFGIFSLIWAFKPIEGIKELLLLVFNFISFFLLIFLTDRANNPNNSIIKGWTILFILTIPIALMELFFDIHFSISKDSEGQIINYGNVAIIRNFASVTYLNLNGYNTMLCYMLPFLSSQLLKKNYRIEALIFWLLYIILGYIIIMNGSRAAFLNYVISIIVFAFYYIERRKSFIKLLIITIIVFFITSYYFVDIFKFISVRFAQEGLNDIVRIQLLSSGWKAFTESNFMGIGAGNFVPVMEYIYKQPVTAPHNFLLEIGVEYGIIVLVLFIGLFLRLWKKLKNKDSKQLNFVVMAALFTFPLLSIIDSGYIISLYPWMYLSSLSVIANQFKQS
jgi:hypothetical protein